MVSRLVEMARWSSDRVGLVIEVQGRSCAAIDVQAVNSVHEVAIAAGVDGVVGRVQDAAMHEIRADARRGL